MSGRHRLAVALLVLLSAACAAGLVGVVGSACPQELPGQPCPDAARNRMVVVALAAGAVALLVTPFAFLADFAVRGRIVYRGSWARAARRGLLAAGVVAALAGLRLGSALSPPAAIFFLVMAIIVEWFAVRRLDLA